MKDHVKAYLDDYDKVVIEIDNTFCGGKSDRFYLLDNNLVFPLEILSSYRMDKITRYETKLNDEIVIGREYQVMAVNGYRTVLQYRFIVKTARFNDEFFYDGDDLGSTLNDKFTRFVLWAPTASQVKVEIEHHGSIKTLDLHRGEKGTFRISIGPRIIGALYRYLIRVNGKWHYSTDPYAKASSANSEKSVVVDVEEYRAENVELPVLEKYSDAIIYETSVRDFTEEGTFEAMSENIDYVKELGITHLQLMPVSDFGSVDELHPELFYNWGYDPVQYQVLEGSYSTNVISAIQVLSDFRNLVNAIHEKGLKVNLDVVFNHVYVMHRHSFELSVPYYYFRYYEDGTLSDGSFCGNDVDTSMPMCRKYIIDTLKYYADVFKIDGFRFDLMGLIDITTMRKAVEELRNIKSDVMIYGEGWNMNTALAESERCCKDNAETVRDIAFFNDLFRDKIKGSTFEAEKKGYASGDVEYIEAASELLQGQPLGSEQSINYVECHDDMTSFDKLRLCCSGEDVIARQKLLIAFVILAQGIPFLHSGQEYCRSKNFVSNSYNQPDDINKLKPEDKAQHQDVIDFTREMIRIRKEYCLAKPADKVMEETDVVRIGNCLVYDLRECNGKDIKIIFNPTDEDVDLEFNNYKYIYGEGIKAVSVAVLEREQ